MPKCAHPPELDRQRNAADCDEKFRVEFLSKHTTTSKHVNGVPGTKQFFAGEDSSAKIHQAVHSWALPLQRMGITTLVSVPGESAGPLWKTFNDITEGDNLVGLSFEGSGPAQIKFLKKVMGADRLKLSITSAMAQLKNKSHQNVASAGYRKVIEMVSKYHAFEIEYVATRWLNNKYSDFPIISRDKRNKVVSKALVSPALASAKPKGQPRLAYDALDDMAGGASTEGFDGAALDESVGLEWDDYSPYQSGDEGGAGSDEDDHQWFNEAVAASAVAVGAAIASPDDTTAWPAMPKAGRGSESSAYVEINAAGEDVGLVNTPRSDSGGAKAWPLNRSFVDALATKGVAAPKVTVTVQQQSTANRAAPSGSVGHVVKAPAFVLESIGEKNAAAAAAAVLPAADGPPADGYGEWAASKSRGGVNYTEKKAHPGQRGADKVERGSPGSRRTKGERGAEKKN